MDTFLASHLALKYFFLMMLFFCTVRLPTRWRRLPLNVYFLLNDSISTCVEIILGRISSSGFFYWVYYDSVSLSYGSDYESRILESCIATMMSRSGLAIRSVAS